ncbi:MAG: arginyltransferase [Gammaproteobacteria bacterium]|nr:arginyltransferase [Gammaproteobacteria bacterium]
MDTEIQIYQTTLSDCPYLDGRKSMNFIIDPEYPLSASAYGHLLECGFRRSSSIVYRPACPGCAECKSSRVPVKSFMPNRSQRRAWKKVSDDIILKPQNDEFNEQHFDLYQRYTRSRHNDSDMAESSISQYMDFLTSSWSNTIFLEIWLKNELLAVAVTDRQPGSLSALYTFFDPEKMPYSPGVVAILSQIELARQYELDWLYLGYWIEACPKMSYKIRYRPIQVLEKGYWLGL